MARYAFGYESFNDDAQRHHVAASRPGMFHCYTPAEIAAAYGLVQV